ncbi:ExbD/TolR family protein [Desulfobacca acetoxidans]|jgi:biopolymer transport protein ExbD|uniref:Biopolymer transport protein ExbD/TolR n=1 Tax=Desulfobacca acetoxidans (strain ATCC 700848 / DSM 11109 / ASRB2) TaxID=880072 RepID=F2NK15_DESAR|nr:biopolymer transporter ExbD [Desulfobacca acetoxidans]AEB09959.1 Biopolymer transport protein ExbD/TolR [Desulfobacca acetoxidans DSM 11109]HAY20853.1 biopolymer transporter ExbD [Desulfobacterales bacterium]
MIEFVRRRKNHQHINLTPLVDVVFLLLLFFMLTAHFVTAPTIKIALPDSKTAEPEVKEEVIISVAKDGALFLDKDPIMLTGLQYSLQEKLKKLKKPSVRIKSDREARLGLIVNVVDEIRLSGAGAFSIETERQRE